MRLETVIKRAEQLGLPVAKDAFRETKETPLPELPYLVYITPQTIGRGSDEAILLNEISVALDRRQQRTRKTNRGKGTF